MIARKLSPVLIVGLIAVLAASPSAFAKGRIVGRVLSDTGTGVGGIRVMLHEPEAMRITNREGWFFFERLAEGVYAITMSLGDSSRSIADIEVREAETASLVTTVDWQPSFADEITVAASRTVERAVDAPAAVTTLSELAIARESSSGDIPKLLEAAPGVSVVNASGFSSEVNARGFNGYNNRRVQVLLDGVDQSVPFAGFQEYIPRNLMDLASVEFVKGPSSSLYGANAFNGVLNLTTKRPESSEGGSLRLTGGDPSFLQAGVRWAGAVGADWFFKVVGNYQEGEYFSRSRTEATEYAGLPTEARPLPDETVASGTLSLRLDRHFEDGPLLTLETGVQELDGNPVALAFPGRFTLVEPIEQSWLRFNLSGRHFAAIAYATDRQASDFVDLATGAHFFDDSQTRHVEIVAHDEFRGARVVGGVSYEEDDIGHSVIGDPIAASSKAVFGQVDLNLTDDVRLALAVRWDEGTLYEGRLSPKAGLVWGIAPNHTLRLTYNEAFQSPTYGDFFLNLPFFLFGPDGPISAVDLSAVEASLCTAVGVSCGFGTPTPARLYGNRELESEEIRSLEAGYSGVFGGRAFLTVDYYRNELEDFLTQPLPDPFGSFNPRFSPYRPPAGHPNADLLLATLQTELGPFYPFLLSEAGGSPVFVPAGFTNAGRVDTQGADIAVSASIGEAWLLDFTYSWFDFEVRDIGLGGALLPNTPEHKAAVGITYTEPRFDISFRYRWVDAFFWSSGVFNGAVPSYGVATVFGNYQIAEAWSVGINVANLLNNIHYEAFGGDLLERRTVVSATYSW